MAALLVAAGVLVYGNSLWGAFIFDDQTAIVKNPHLQRLWPLWEAMRAPRDTPLAGRPIVSLSMAVNYALGGWDVRGYHVVNVAVHLLCALLLFGVVRRTLLQEPVRHRFGAASEWIAFGCALIWLVHPLQTEPVNYLTQRTELLVGLFYLLTLYAAIRAHDLPRRSWWVAIAVSACALGMASKEVMITAPAIVLLYDLVFQPEPVASLFRRRTPLYAGLTATWAVLAALIWSTPRSITAGFSTPIGRLQYAMNQCPMILRYLRLAVWPRPLVLDYGPPPSVGLAQVAPAAVVIVLLLAATAVALARRMPAGFAGAWFFVILAPTSSFVPIASEVGAERRMYLPLAAVVALALTCGSAAVDRLRAQSREHSGTETTAGSLRPGEWYGVLAVAAFAIALGAVSMRRNVVYRSPEAIWASVVAERPGARAHNNLGSALADEGRYPEAITHYREALRIDGELAEAHFNLAVGLCTERARDECAVEFREYLRRKPDNPRAHYLLGIDLVELGQSAAAAAHFREAVRLRPDFVDVHADLGAVMLAANQPEEAAEHFSRYLQDHPDSAPIHNSLGMALAQQRKMEEAVVHFRTAVRIDPRIADAQYHLGRALAMAGDIDQAAEHLHEAVRLKPSLRAEVDEILKIVGKPVTEPTTPPAAPRH